LTEEFQRNHDNWDFENAEVHEGLKNPGARYSVRFSREESDTVGAAAEAAGMTIFEFIHDAAIAAAKGESAAQLHASIAELRDAVKRAESALKAVEEAPSPARKRAAS
jgi:uncharacterized protein (DUF1778 family)